MKNKKLALGGGAVGVILLGLLTNAIWEGLKPATTYLFKIFLNLSILGVEKFKDNIYVEIAKGMHEGTSLQVYLIVYTLLLSLVCTTVFAVFLIQKRITSREDDGGVPTFFDKIYLYQKDLPRKSWFLWFSLLYVLFVGTILTLDSVKQGYINGAVTNFEQLSRIVRPYISEEESIRYTSSFSQIENREDYINLVSKLQNIARDNNQRIPDFDFTF